MTVGRVRREENIRKRKHGRFLPGLAREHPIDKIPVKEITEAARDGSTAFGILKACCQKKDRWPGSRPLPGSCKASICPGLSI
jgi:hypothetical protein